jgi:hypothetical protein
VVYVLQGLSDGAATGHHVAAGWAGVSASHGDHEVGGLHNFVGEGFGELRDTPIGSTCSDGYEASLVGVSFALAHPDVRAPTRLVSVILVWTLSYLVELPGGVFRMGSQQFYPDEGRFMTSIQAFAIEQHPVTNAQFLEFVSRPVT